MAPSASPSAMPSTAPSTPSAPVSIEKTQYSIANPSNTERITVGKAVAACQSVSANSIPMLQFSKGQMIVAWPHA
jgi:hypothetical protein